MAPRTLIVGRLTVQSSYLRNEETAATPDRFDTVQWWLGGPRGWRIRTYAADLDIHLHRFDPVADVADFAVRSTAANYGEVLESLLRVDFIDHEDQAAVDRELHTALGAPGFEYASDLDMGFWNPGRLRYATQSSPE